MLNLNSKSPVSQGFWDLVTEQSVLPDEELNEPWTH